MTVVPMPQPTELSPHPHLADRGFPFDGGCQVMTQEIWSWTIMVEGFLESGPIIHVRDHVFRLWIPHLESYTLLAYLDSGHILAVKFIEWDICGWSLSKQQSSLHTNDRPHCIFIALKSYNTTSLLHKLQHTLPPCWIWNMKILPMGFVLLDLSFMCNVL